ncbi:18124_t:CDS:2, partial [Gigaspora margarita]
MKTSTLRTPIQKYQKYYNIGHCFQETTTLASTNDTIALKNLVMRNDYIGKDFQENIRAYNSIFAFTSMGIKLDESLADNRKGIYTFRDTEFEMNNRLPIMPKLRHDTLDNVRRFCKNGIPDGYPRINAMLLHIKSLLEQYYKLLSDYDLPTLKLPTDLPNELPRLIINELNIPVSIEDLTKIELLNKDQKLVLDTIIKRIEMNLPAVIFIDGPAVNATFKFSPLWSAVKIFYFHQNMRIENGPEANKFKNFLLRIRNGTEKIVNNNIICILNQIVINWPNEQLLQTLIEQIYPILHTNSSNTLNFTDKAILTTKNEYVDYINNTILNRLPNESIIYQSFDSVLDDTRNLYQQEFLNSINTTDISSHELHLKINTPIICFCNLNPINSLYNGTKLIYKAFSPNIINTEITTGNHQ